MLSVLSRRNLDEYDFVATHAEKYNNELRAAAERGCEKVKLSRKFADVIRCFAVRVY